MDRVFNYEIDADVLKFLMDAWGHFEMPQQWTLDPNAGSPDFITGSDKFYTLQRYRELLGVDKDLDAVEFVKQLPMLIQQKNIELIDSNKNAGRAPTTTTD